MLKSVPMGQSVDVVLRRGYPMLYNPDGCPKQSLETVLYIYPIYCFSGCVITLYNSLTLYLTFMPSTATDSQRAV